MANDLPPRLWYRHGFNDGFARKTRGWRRVRRYRLASLPGRFEISFRNFRTQKVHRSKRYRQLVLQVPLLPVREISIRTLPKAGQSRAIGQSKSHRLNPTYQPFVNATLITIGTLGTLYFSQNIRQPVELFLPPDLPTVQAAAAPTNFLDPLKSLPASDPTHVSIARVGIDAGIVNVGQQADGTMETPPLFGSDAGWYELGPTPGEIGPSIIVGHVDTYKGPAPFWRLREVQPGDVVEIERKDGRAAKFKVDKVEQFVQNEFPTESVYGNVNYAAIRLITCGGKYDTKTNRYSHNTVVFGSLIL